MPVRRFRSIEQMPDAPRYVAGSHELAIAIARIWVFASKTCPQHFPPGVYRHHSYDEAEALAATWERANVAMHQRRKRQLR